MVIKAVPLVREGTAKVVDTEGKEVGTVTVSISGIKCLDQASHGLRERYPLTLLPTL